MENLISLFLEIVPNKPNLSDVKIEVFDSLCKTVKLKGISSFNKVPEIFLEVKFATNSAGNNFPSFITVLVIENSSGTFKVFFNAVVDKNAEAFPVKESREKSAATFSIFKLL